MDEIAISLDTTGRLGEVTTVRVDGVIDTMTATELERVMNSLLEQKKYRIIVDLAGVDYISSAGWGIFISNIREIKAHDGDIKLARMIPSVYEIFELLEFDSILKAYDNIERAKAEFKSTDRPKPNPIARAGADEGLGNFPSGNPVAQAVEITTEEYQPQPESVIVQTAVAQAAAAPPEPITVEQEVLGLVKADPFYSIRELVKLVNSTSDSSKKRAGWWSIWRILRRNSLLSKRDRFRYSRKG